LWEGIEGEKVEYVSWSAQAAASNSIPRLYSRLHLPFPFGVFCFHFRFGFWSLPGHAVSAFWLEVDEGGHGMEEIPTSFLQGMWNSHALQGLSPMPCF